MRSLRRPPSSLLPVLLLAALALAAAACGGDGESSGEGLVVVATNSIVGDLADRVVGGEGRVEVLVERDTDPHDFQLSSEQGALLRRADLVVAVGLGLEEGMEDALAAAEVDGVPVLRLAPLLDPLPLEEDGDREGDDGHEHGADPHFWHDPLRMAEAALLLSGALEERALGGWRQRAETVAEELRRLDAELAETYAGIPEGRRRLVTTHRSLGYLASRYGLEVVGTVIPGGSTLAEPSSAQLAELVSVVERWGVRAILTENVASPRLASVLAEELGGDVRVVPVYTDALGPEGGEAADYPGMMRANAARIVEALG